MGGVFRSWQWWLKTFRNLFLDKQIIRGEMSLGFGDHEIHIPIPDFVPGMVSVSLEEPEDATICCMGNINLGGTKLLPDGFILYARIQSNTCIVRWIVESCESMGKEELEDKVRDVAEGPPTGK
jgi:hypothetical protein